MKKGGKDFTPCRPNRIRTSEQKNCPVLCGFHCTVPASVQVDLRFVDTTMWVNTDNVYTRRASLCLSSWFVQAGRWIRFWDRLSLLLHGWAEPPLSFCLWSPPRLWWGCVCCPYSAEIRIKISRSAAARRCQSLDSRARQPVFGIAFKAFFHDSARARVVLFLCCSHIRHFLLDN